MNKKIEKILDEIIPNPKCSLNYNKDYELLIATILSAQCTDTCVNKVTKELFRNFDIFKLAKSHPSDIIDIIRPCGQMVRKSEYIINVSKALVNDYNGILPNDRDYLESLPGVGRKTANVVLANIFNEPTFAVDTHVKRVSKRLGFANEDDNELVIENKLMKIFEKDNWSRLHHQLVLFGRHYCTSRNPKCDDCKLRQYCKYLKCK